MSSPLMRTGHCKTHVQQRVPSRTMPTCYSPSRPRNDAGALKKKKRKKKRYIFGETEHREYGQRKRGREQTHVQVLRHCAAAAQRRVGLRACSPAPLAHGNPMLGTRERQMCLLTSYFSGAQTLGHVCPLEGPCAVCTLSPFPKVPKPSNGQCKACNSRGERMYSPALVLLVWVCCIGSPLVALSLVCRRCVAVRPEGRKNRE